jgi:hypothetical protein
MDLIHITQDGESCMRASINLRGRSHFGGLGVGVKIIRKLILNK